MRAASCLLGLEHGNRCEKITKKYEYDTYGKINGKSIEVYGGGLWFFIVSGLISAIAAPRVEQYWRMKVGAEENLWMWWLQGQGRAY